MVTIYRRSPVRELTVTDPYVRPLDIMDEAEMLLNEVWTPRWGRTVGTGGIPMDMYEHKGELFIRGELPGFKREDIDLRFEGDTLTIKAEKKEGDLKDVTYHTQERCYGEYMRTIPLPFPVNSDKFSATFENGLLEIRVPKAEEVKGKHIEIRG